MNTTKDLVRAILLAYKLHDGQLRANGDPYIGHPLSVMLGIVDSTSINVKIAAVLHDTVEDCEYTFEQAEDDFGPHVAFLLNAVTRREDDDGADEPYSDFIDRVVESGGDAILIKIADINDNLSDLHNLQDEAKRLRLSKKYQNALTILLIALMNSKGDN